MSAPSATEGASTTRRLPRFGLALIGVLLIAANLRASFTAVGPVLGLMRQDLGLNGTAAGLLTSLPLLAFAAFSPAAPLLARSLGLDRALRLALLLIALGIVARSVLWEAGVWIGTGSLGIGIAIINVLLPSLVKRDFPHRVAQVTGVYSAFQSSVAALAAGVVVPIADASPLGWRLALGVWAGIALIAMAVPLRRSRVRDAPEPGTATATNVSAAPPTSPWTSALGWQVTIFMGLQSVPFFILVAWLPSILHDRGIAAGAAGWYLFLFQVVAILGNLGTATLAHRLTDQRLIGLTGGVLCFLTYGGLLLAPQMALLWTVTGGLGCGSTIVLALSLFSLRTRTHNQAAALSGMAQSVGYLLAAAGPIAFGGLHDVTGGWSIPLALTTATMAAMSVFAMLASRNRMLS